MAGLVTELNGKEKRMRNRSEVIELICEYGNSKDYIKKIHSEMDLLKADIEAMRQLSAVNYDGMPKGSTTSDPTAKAATYIVDVYESRIETLKGNVERIMRRKALAEELLDRLTDDERKVIEERYIKGTRWDFIPGILHFERTWCFELRKRALKKMCKC